MRFIITAGGTTEAIDGVRGITNFSSGRLGQQLAATLVVQGHEVNFLHGKRTGPVPGASNLVITDTASLVAAFQQLHGTGHVDAIVHAMAVSDRL